MCLILYYCLVVACSNIFNTIKASGKQFFRKIYLSLYLKGFERVTKSIICERWVRDWKELQHIDPPISSGYSSISFPFSWAAHPGAWGPSLCRDMVLVPASSLKLLWNSCRQGYIIIWRTPTSCERQNSHSIQPFDSQVCLLISLTGWTCFLCRCISSFDSLAGVDMLHCSLLIFWCISIISRSENQPFFSQNILQVTKNQCFF